MSTVEYVDAESYGAGAGASASTGGIDAASGVSPVMGMVGAALLNHLSNKTSPTEAEASFLQTAVTQSIRQILPPQFEAVYEGMDWMNIPHTFCVRLLCLLQYLEEICPNEALSAAVSELQHDIIGDHVQEQYLIQIWHIRCVYQPPAPGEEDGMRVPYAKDIFDLVRARHTDPEAIVNILRNAAIRPTLDATGITSVYSALEDDELEYALSLLDVINGTVELYELVPSDMEERLRSAFESLNPEAEVTQESASSIVRSLMGTDLMATLRGEQPLEAVTLERLFAWTSHIAHTHTARKVCDPAYLAMLDTAVENKHVILAACGSSSMPDMMKAIQKHFTDLQGGDGGAGGGTAASVMSMIATAASVMGGAGVTSGGAGAGPAF
jgi:hypothetical protein